MAMAKSSRSRMGHSGMLQANGVAGNGIAATDSPMHLTDMLQIFKLDNFDPDGYVQSKCQAMSEKVINPDITRIWNRRTMDLRFCAPSTRMKNYITYSTFEFLQLGKIFASFDCGKGLY